MTALPRNIEKLSVAELSDLQRKITVQMVKRYEESAASVKQREAALEAKKVALQDKLARMATDLNTHTVKVFGAPVVKMDQPANGQHGPKRIRAKSKKPIAIKYRNPAQPTETWTGRGRAPRWLAALEVKGARRQDFAVA